MNAPPLILHLRASNFVGGPERQILHYCGAAGADSGWRQAVVTFLGPGGEGEAFLRAVRGAGQEGWALPAEPRAAVAALTGRLRRERVSLLCTHGYRADLLGTLAARRARVPVAWFLRGWTAENAKVRFYEYWDRVCMTGADRIVCLSRTQSAQLPARIPGDRVRVVVNAVEAPAVEAVRARQRLCRQIGIADGEALLVAIAGRLSPEKGAMDFLAAAARVGRSHARAHFLVVGDGPLRARLEARGQGLGLGRRIHFAGYLANWNTLLPGIDVLVNPSHREQAPNVVLEAMAARVAVLATSVGAVPEIGSDTIALAPPAEPEALATALAGLLEAPAARAALAERAFYRAQTEYSTARQQSQLQDLYREFAAPWRAAGGGGQPTVSVVMPVRNEAAHLPAVLDQLLSQDYPAERLEILIADGGGEGGDGTTAVAHDYARRYPDRVRWLRNPGQLSSAGRNCGVAAARGEWIVFVDGHCALPGPHWLTASMDAVRATGAVCLSRPQPLCAEAGHAWQQAIASARASRIGHGADSTIYATGASGWVHPGSSGAAYHRSLFERVGWFDETFDACEDVEFNHRLHLAGVRAWLCPAAAVYYQARTSPGALWRQMVRYGRGRVRLARKHPSAASVAQTLPAVWLAMAPTAVAAVMAGMVAGFGRLNALAALALASYAAIVAGTALVQGGGSGPRAALALVTIHAGLGAGTWQELATGRRRRGVPDTPLPSDRSSVTARS